MAAGSDIKDIIAGSDFSDVVQETFNLLPGVLWFFKITWLGYFFSPKRSEHFGDGFVMAVSFSLGLTLSGLLLIR